MEVTYGSTTPGEWDDICDMSIRRLARSMYFNILVKNTEFLSLFLNNFVW